MVFVLFYQCGNRLSEYTGLAWMTALVTGVPTPECLTLEAKSCCISIIHSHEKLEILFPKTNDSAGGPQLVPGQTVIPGLYLFQVSLEYRLFHSVDLCTLVAWGQNKKNMKKKQFLENDFNRKEMDLISFYSVIKWMLSNTSWDPDLYQMWSLIWDGLLPLTPPREASCRSTCNWPQCVIWSRPELTALPTRSSL